MRKRILIVDDSRSMRVSFRKPLSTYVAQGKVLSYDEAEDGIVALSQVFAHPGDNWFVLTDWEMPGMDGLTLARELWKIRASTRSYVVLMSGNVDQIPPDKVQLYEMRGLLSKAASDFNPQLLLHIDAFLRG